jgi:SAM-dependent methyltransferase
VSLRRVGSWVRRARARLKGWSPETDREYHDSIFAEAHHDPFSHCYPGNITIRRFADLLSPHLAGVGDVLDLGCGTGEITCELASRHPEVSFEGIDHSEAGIERARANAARRGLRKVSFRTADVERFEPEHAVDLVMMLDAFHHLLDPDRFVRRMGAFTGAFVLIEPQGDWKGAWRRDLDFDWLVQDLENVRARIAHATGEPESVRSAPPSGDAGHGEPVEHRYTMEDFRRFFPGYGLTIRGTVSGIETYPPRPDLESPSRERFGRLGYELYSEIDEGLRARDLDLFAKHLVICAVRGGADGLRARPERPKDVPWASHASGPYDVVWLGYDGPNEAPAAREFLAQVRLRNASFRAWSSDDPERPDYLSYHWLDRRGVFVEFDGPRTPLRVGPGDEVEVSLHVRTPAEPGRYVLALDLVQEQRTWFSRAGSPCLRIPFRARGSP